MNDPNVRVNPSSVRSYGSSATENFGQIRTQLETLCSDMVAVDYYGPNAVQFKTQCGQMASAFASALMTDMTKIADAVRTTTTNIAASLGGAPVDIQFDASTIEPPAVPQGDESVGVNLPALEGMKGTVDGCFAAINQQFSDHLSALQGTDWMGNAKENAVGSVSTFTTSAQTKCEEAKSELNAFIDQQVESTSRANQ